MKKSRFSAEQIVGILNDFIHDRCEDGRPFRSLTLVDEQQQHPTERLSA